MPYLRTLSVDRISGMEIESILDSRFVVFPLTIGFNFIVWSIYILYRKRQEKRNKKISDDPNKVIQSKGFRKYLQKILKYSQYIFLLRRHWKKILIASLALGGGVAFLDKLHIMHLIKQSKLKARGGDIDIDIRLDQLDPEGVSIVISRLDPNEFIYDLDDTILLKVNQLYHKCLGIPEGLSYLDDDYMIKKIFEKLDIVKTGGVIYVTATVVC